MISHRTLDGGWAVCPAPDACELLFHIPGMTPDVLTAMSLNLLLPLLEVIDPPAQVMDEVKYWSKDTPYLPYLSRLHRDYDLPAMVDPSTGAMRWYQHGKLHRENDQPAFIDGYGTMAWYQEGVYHRAHGEPAVIWADGETEFYEHGNALSDGEARRRRLVHSWRTVGVA